MENNKSIKWLLSQENKEIIQIIFQIFEAVKNPIVLGVQLHGGFFSEIYDIWNIYIKKNDEILYNEIMELITSCYNNICKIYPTKQQYYKPPESQKLNEMFKWIENANLSDVAMLINSISFIQGYKIQQIMRQSCEDFGCYYVNNPDIIMTKECTRLCCIENKEERTHQVMSLLRLSYHRCRELTNIDPLAKYGWYIAPILY